MSSLCESANQGRYDKRCQATIRGITKDASFLNTDAKSTPRRYPVHVTPLWAHTAIAQSHEEAAALVLTVRLKVAMAEDCQIITSSNVKDLWGKYTLHVLRDTHLYFNFICSGSEPWFKSSSAYLSLISVLTRLYPNMKKFRNFKI